jgi:hypothetical protein
MLIPRFTMRHLLGFMAIGAVCFAILSAALRGLDGQAETEELERAENPAYMAAGVSVAIFAASASMATFAGLFLTAWVAAQLTSAVRPSTKPKSPFAQHTPAPQLLPPEEPV